MIYVTGDTHADFDDYRLEQIASLNKNDILIVCGDFGFDWNDYVIANYKRLQFNCTVLFVDGNHENFDILNSLPTKEMFGGIVSVFDENTYYLHRGEMYTIEGKKFFCFGGASSIDKEWRLAMMSKGGNKIWWEEEIPAEEDYNHALETLKKYNYKFDYFITHACNPDLKCFVLETYKKDFFDPTESMIQGIEWTIKENNGSYLGHFFGHYHVNCGSGKEHCLYDNIVNLSENTITTKYGNKYEFNIEGNPSRADFGVKIQD